MTATLMKINVVDKVNCHGIPSICGYFPAYIQKDKHQESTYCVHVGLYNRLAGRISSSSWMKLPCSEAVYLWIPDTLNIQCGRALLMDLHNVLLSHYLTGSINCRDRHGICIYRFCWIHKSQWWRLKFIPSNHLHLSLLCESQHWTQKVALAFCQHLSEITLPKHAQYLPKPQILSMGLLHFPLNLKLC